MGAVTSEVLHALTTCLSAAYTRGLSGVTPQWQRIASEIPSSSA
ncbi:Mu-like prophage major head subunit gpT family protein, partial [Escherichia coli]|nr:Mu-like prophage major head subunit gpT family protein [Escherichia coli]